MCTSIFTHTHINILCLYIVCSKNISLESSEILQVLLFKFKENEETFAISNQEIYKDFIVF